jgi:hypothetical protein
MDRGLFGELLSRMGEDSGIVNYLTKPVETITASEAMSFRRSVYANLIQERIVGVEAAEDTPPDATAEDAGEADPTATDEASTEDPSMPTDGAMESPEDEQDEGSDAKPQIDPEKMLLEIAKPGEPMSDYIYRDMIARRIANILRNPPENAKPNDLLMLKRWRSRWLYLASVATLRDFLTRVSLRLTNT